MVSDLYMCACRWLRQEYQLQFPPDKQPPLHMPIAYGLVGLSKPKQDSCHSLSQPEPSGGVVGGGASEILHQGCDGMQDDERLHRSSCQLCEEQIENVRLLIKFRTQDLPCPLCLKVS